MIRITKIFTLVLMLVAAAVGRNSGGEYLYTVFGNTQTFSNVDPVIDYIEPKQLPFETKEQYEKRKHNPTFLGEYADHRIVEFYAPWCGHCIHFKPKYIQIAREVNNVEALEFYAVSCQVHKAICRNQEIKGYPTVKWFPANSSVGEVISGNTISSDTIVTKYLHIDLSHSKARGITSAISLRGSLPQANTQITRHKNELNAQKDREKFHVFQDASMSFYYAMRNEIFLTEDGLNQDQSDALRTWLEVLSKVLPVPMKHVKHDASSLLASFDEIVISESMLEQHIINGNRTDKWTDYCNKGKEGAGYTCGLWNLFHIVTISTFEFNNIASHDDTISPSFVARAIRDYIEHFFACIECRDNFLKMFDNCRFGVCQHLRGPEITDKDFIDAEWLPLWLWQAHNDVNMRLEHENKKDQKVYMSLTTIGHESSLWPSLNDCLSCWQDGFTKWNSKEVLAVLRKTYWSTATFDLSSSDVIMNGMSQKIFQRNQDRIICIGLLVVVTLYFSIQRGKQKIRRTQKTS